MPIDRDELILHQYEDGYRYNSDSVLLYDFISSFELKGKVLDVGSGCGILGLLLKRDNTDLDITQIELQKDHYRLNEKNATQNTLKAQIICDDFILHHFDSRYDMLISNPPFYHKSSQKSSQESLYLSRHSDAMPVEKFVRKSYEVLAPKGRLIFCYDAKQIDFVLHTLLESKMKLLRIRFVHPKPNDDASIVLICAQKNSKSLTKIDAPLFIYDDAQDMLPHIQDLYEKVSLKSVSCKR